MHPWYEFNVKSVRHCHDILDHKGKVLKLRSMEIKSKERTSSKVEIEQMHAS